MIPDVKTSGILQESEVGCFESITRNRSDAKFVFAKDCSGKVTVPDTVMEIGGAHLRIWGWFQSISQMG